MDGIKNSIQSKQLSSWLLARHEFFFHIYFFYSRHRFFDVFYVAIAENTCIFLLQRCTVQCTLYTVYAIMYSVKRTLFVVMQLNYCSFEENFQKKSIGLRMHCCYKNILTRFSSQKKPEKWRAKNVIKIRRERVRVLSDPCREIYV